MFCKGSLVCLSTDDGGGGRVRPSGRRARRPRALARGQSMALLPGPQSDVVRAADLTDQSAEAEKPVKRAHEERGTRGRRFALA